MDCKKITFSVLFVLLFQFLLANDSTLFLKRISKIKSLARELGSLGHPLVKPIADSVDIINFYSSIEKKYFGQNLKSKEYKISYALHDFREIVNDLGIDSLILRYPDAKIGSVTDVKELHDYLANTVILYFPMYEMEFEGFYFAFQKKSDNLMYLIEAGGEDAEYRRKKLFLNQIHSSQNN